MRSLRGGDGGAGGGGGGVGERALSTPTLPSTSRMILVSEIQTYHGRCVYDV